MANTINPNSFFNQEDDGTASSALALAQKTFNITETIKEQVDSLVGNLDAFKLEFNEYNTENTTNITKIFNDYSTLTERVDNVGNDVDAVSKVFFDFQGAQEREKKESLIQAEREAEAERDKTWEERDKQQKTKEEKGGKGGRAGGAVASSGLDASDGVTKDGTDKERGFWGKLGQGLMSPITGLMHLTAAAGGTLTHGIMGGLDWLTGNRTDFDAGGGEKKDIPGTKLFKGIKNMFGNKDKTGGQFGVSSDIDKMVNMDAMKVIDEKKESKYKGLGLFGGLFGNKGEEGEDADTKAIVNLNERLVALEDEEEGGKKDDDDKKDKKKNRLFKRLFGGKKDDDGEPAVTDDPIQKSVKGKEMVVYTSDAGEVTFPKGKGLDALSKEEAKSEFLRLKNKDKKSRKENSKLKRLSVVLNDKFGVNTKDIQTNVNLKAAEKDEMGLITPIEGESNALEKKNDGEKDEGKGAIQKLVEGPRPVITEDMTIEQKSKIQRQQKLWDSGQAALGKGKGTFKTNVPVEDFEKFIDHATGASVNTDIKPATREQSLMQSLVEPPPPELSSPPTGTDQPGNEGDPEEDASVEGEQEPVAGAANNEEAIPAEGTACSIECIQVSKSNSTALLMY